MSSSSFPLCKDTRRSGAMAMIVFVAAAPSSSVPPPPPTHDDEHDEGLALAVLADQQPMEVDESDDPESEVDYVPPLREEELALAIIACQQTMAADECGDPESEVEFVPLRIVRPEDEQPKRRGWRVKVCAHKPKTKKVKRTRPAYSKSDKTDKDDNFAPMGKRGRPARAKSAKSKTWHNPEFVYGDNINISSSSESESKGNKGADYNLSRKRGRPARAKTTKSNMWRKLEFVYGDNLDISSSGSETEENKDDNYNPMLLWYGGTAFERASGVMRKLPGKGASFIKLMQPSHVDRVFWLGLPRKFCKEHLPEKDTSMTLEDDEGRVKREEGCTGCAADGDHTMVTRISPTCANIE